MTNKTIKSITSSCVGFLFVIVSYLFLVSQTSNAWLGTFGVSIYFLQYFVLYFFISFVQNKWYISPLVGFINAALLFALQLSRSRIPSDWISFAWDYNILLEVLFIAFINFLISLTIILKDKRSKD